MKYTEIVSELKRVLDRRFPGGYNYIPVLAGIIGVSTKSVMRKLRGETRFSIEEMVAIGKTLDISLGGIFEAGHSSVKHPMEIYLHDFSVTKEFQTVVSKMLEAYGFAARSRNSKYMIASNTMPEVVFSNHELIGKFCYIKWLYFNKGADAMVPLSSVQFTEQDLQVHTRYLENIISMKKSVYIFNIDMMKFVSDELIFFLEMSFLSREEAKALVEEYVEVLDKMEEICKSGLLPGTQKEIDVFYSNILLPNDIVIIESDNLRLAMICAYFLNPIITKSDQTFEIIKDWYYSFVRSANIISLSGTKQRLAFFDRQREYLSKLGEEIEVKSL